MPEASYTARRDNQGVSDPAMLVRAVEAATGFTTRLPAILKVD